MKYLFLAFLVGSVASAGDIEDLAETSQCAKASWRDRGKAPIGYVKGMAVAYARSVCRWNSPLSTVAGLTGKVLGSSSKDALTHYGIKSVSGRERLRQTWTLGIGLGMRESSGKYCIGRDTSANNVTASTCEAGPFQQSYNSAGVSPRLGDVWAWYKLHSKQCNLITWSDDVNPAYYNCKTRSYGTGTGFAWQEFTRTCPAFAAEWAMVLVRNLKSHFGPLVRKEVQYKPECEDMLKKIDKLVTPQLCIKLLGE